MFLFFVPLSGQCDSDYNKNQSPKIANYKIKAHLDHKAKLAICTQELTWTNTSPDTIHELRLYMYMNAFKDLSSTYLKGANGNIFGQDLSNRPAIEWGHITITKLLDESGKNLTDRQKYIQPNDQNKDDQSVVEIALLKPILPGETKVYNFDFTVKLPKTIVRSGFGKDDFFLFVHWFPQMGVYEQDKDGRWGWNCHQFFRGTEFFADFGDYEVEIDASDHLVIGGSGCRISEEKNKGRQVVKFLAHDLIDFGWVVYSNFEVYTSKFNGVDIEILMPPEHCAFADRYLTAIEHGLEYLGNNIGPYPYPKITVVDPPVHTLNSGFMEYPMMITAASFYGIPRSIRSVESLVIHEFTHMYFMATLASNEKEEAWLDEGFVTYYEDRIMDHYYGNKSSLFNVLGFKSGNAENSRLEYVGLPDPGFGKIARPGWDFEGSYKGLIYAKTSTMLRTLERNVTKPIMDEIIKAYFQAYQFKHPKEADFRRIVAQVLEKMNVKIPLNIPRFFDQCLHGSEVCDFELKSIESTKTEKGYTSTIDIMQNGGLLLPVDILVAFEDGSTKKMTWDGQGGSRKITIDSNTDIVSVHIDPEQKIDLDLNFINNSFTRRPNTKPIIKYAMKAENWMQSLFHYASFLM